jgi:hypothetical protein
VDHAISYASTDQEAAGFARYPRVFNGKSKLGPKKLKGSHGTIMKI